MKDCLAGKKHVHFIGIGGSGMYPLAQILHSKGYYLTGSDNNETETLDLVRKMGVPVYLGQRAENIEGADLIVYTAAIMDDNPELIAAKNSSVPVIERADLLGLITRKFKNTVCVAGTHGKTTVTSMLTQIFLTQRSDVSAVIGGKLKAIGGGGVAGNGDDMICEACEFKDHFLKLAVGTAVVLNVDEDHLDYFKDLDNIINSFHRFCLNAKNAVIINGDDKNSMKAAENISKPIITFGRESKNDWYAENIVRDGDMKTTFSIIHLGKEFCRVTINVPGEHNIVNALAAAAAAHYSGISAKGIAEGLNNFYGAARRFEKYGEYNGITIVDDYGHHPAEITAALKAAKGMKKYKRVWAVHQPFTYSRTFMLMDDFAKALSIADKVVLTEIMGSREKNTFNVHTSDLCERIEGAVWFPEFEQTADYVVKNAKAGDLIITLGCGDVYKVARMICKILERKQNENAN